MTTRNATVMLVDDHAVIRAGIRLLLESQGGVTVVAEASSAEEALGISLTRDPDVIVTDLSMEGLRGAAVVEAFAERFPEARILVLSMVDSPIDIRHAIDAGARGYLLKGAGGRRARGRDRPDPERRAVRAAGSRGEARRQSSGPVDAR